MKKRAIIIDLDGTLCNTTHRQHFMDKKRKNWKAFYDNLVKDEPHEWCRVLIQGMSPILQIIFVSGRPDSYKEQTQEWLKRHGFGDFPLFMRKDGDFRKDSIVKSEIYHQHIEPEFEILFCVDDRQQVVDAWREMGLTCLQCAKGDF